MAIAAPTFQSPRPLRWTKAQYYQLGELGLFGNKRVELIEGEIIEMQPIGVGHLRAVNVGNRVLARAFGDGFYVSVQNPFDVGGDTEPQPDLAVLAGEPGDLEAVPSLAALIVEVSEWTLAYDRTTKARLYARAEVADYWIVNLVDRQVEVHRQPDVVTGQYVEISVLRAGDSIAPRAAPEAMVAIADLLP